MPREHPQSEEFERGSWNLDDFMRSQSEALYRQTREEALSSWGSGAAQQRIGERREGFDRRSERRRESQRHDVPERRASERRRGAERRILGGKTLP